MGFEKGPKKIDRIEYREENITSKYYGDNVYTNNLLLAKPF